MPSKSRKQARLMAAVAHNPKFAKKVGIPQSVGREFYAADKARGRFAKGGRAKSVRELTEALKLWKENKLPQEGFFSTLDELIATAPQEQMPVFQWQKYLKPGRMLRREDVEFPLKQEEIDYANLANMHQPGFGALFDLDADLPYGPDTQLTKDQVRDFVRRYRPDINLRIGSEKVTGPLTSEFLRDFQRRRGLRDATAGVREGEPFVTSPSYDTDTLRHPSNLGSYEENVTVGPDLSGYQSHFSPHDISWSRTTRHEVSPRVAGLPNDTVRNPTFRLIEEIQSDRHSNAAEKVFRTNAATKQEYEDAIQALVDKYPTTPMEYWKGFTNVDDLIQEHGRTSLAKPEFARFAEAIQKAQSRLGYRNNMDAAEIRILEDNVPALRERAKELERGYKWQHEQGPREGGFASPEDRARRYQEVIEARDDLNRNAERLRQLKMKPPDAPYKDPRDYSTLEIRKQLLNAVRENDSFLGITRGADQIARYEAGMDPRRTAGMQEMYDRLYPSVLKKEAGRYGAQTKDVEVPMMFSTKDVRPETFADVGAETFDDFIERTADLSGYNNIGEGISDQIDTMRELLGEFQRALNETPDYTDKKAATEMLDKIELKLKQGESIADDMMEKFTADSELEVPEVYGQGGAQHLLERWYADHWQYLKGKEMQSGAKSFPAAHLTPEVRDKIRRIGVPIFSAAGAAALGYDMSSEDAGDEPVFAEGGKVSNKPKKTLDWWRAVADSMGNAVPFTSEETRGALSDMLARPLSGLASQVLTRDPETGEMYLGTRPGIIDEFQSLPTLYEDAGDLLMGPMGGREAVQALSGVHDPQLLDLTEDMLFSAPDFAHEAAERTERNYDAARRGMGLDDPHGFGENILEAGGVMAGQVPMPGGIVRRLKALAKSKPSLKLAGKVVGPAVEWLTPTIDPKVGNYLKGAVAGGTLHGLGDMAGDMMDEAQQAQFIREAVAEVLAEETGATDEDINAAVDEAATSMGYAEGGRVGGARRALRALREQLKAINISPDEKYLIGSPREEALYAINEGVRKGAMTPQEATAFKERLATGDESVMADTLLELHNRLYPPRPAPTSTVLNTGTAPLETKPLHFNQYIGPGPIHGKLSEEDFQQILLDPRYQKPLEKAEGGEVQDPRGTPLSQEWFENYGAGPEHLFMGDRKIALSPYWGPQHPAPAPDTTPRPSGSIIPGLAALGLAGRDLYNRYRNRGDVPAGLQGVLDQGIAGGIADTEAANQRDFDNMDMPWLNDDGSVTHIPGGTDPDFWERMNDAARNFPTQTDDEFVNEYNRTHDMPTADFDVEPGLLDRTWSGGGGALDLYIGSQRGGIGGAGQALTGAEKLGEALGYSSDALDMVGRAGRGLSGVAGIVSGIDQGGVEGYARAGVGAAQTANQLGLLSSGASQLAGKAVPVVGAALSAYGAYESAAVGDKKGAVSQGAMAGASIGSVIPVIGTAVGAAIGAVVGLIGASLGNKENPSELAYGAYKKVDPNQTVRGWTEDQINGAMFETIKSHTKSGNINRFGDVREMYEAFGITKDAHKNYRNVQDQMNKFIEGTIRTAQDLGALPTDPAALRQLDGQQIYHKIVVPALAAKYKETTGRDSTAWKVDHAGGDSVLQNLFADKTDWMLGHWGEVPKTPIKAGPSGAKGKGMVQKKARGGRIYGRPVNTYEFVGGELRVS